MEALFNEWAIKWRCYALLGVETMSKNVQMHWKWIVVVILMSVVYPFRWELRITLCGMEFMGLLSDHGQHTLV